MNGSEFLIDVTGLAGFEVDAVDDEVESDAVDAAQAGPVIEAVVRPIVGGLAPIPSRLVVTLGWDRFDVLDASLRALTHDPMVFQRDQNCVRVIRVTTRTHLPVGLPQIVPIPRLHAAAVLSRCVQFQRLVDGKPEPCAQPDWLAQMMIHHREYPFRYLGGIVEAPIFRADGTVLRDPGYDSMTGLLFEPRGEYPEVDDAPTFDDAKAAAARLLAPFAQFPFLADCDRSVVLAGILTLVGRHAIAGATPIFAVRAHTPGTGKSLLCRCMALIGTAREPAAHPATSDEDESRKLIHALAMEAPPVLVLDNVNGAFGTASWARVASAKDTVADRTLGVSGTATFQWRTVTFINGNNQTYVWDLGRRVLPCDLDSGGEHPEAREFTEDDLETALAGRQRELHADALTVLRAFHVAGRPRHGKSPFGSFEAWDRLVRSAIVWLGLADPCEGRKRIADEDDDDRATIGGLLACVYDVYGDAEWGASMLVDKASVLVDKALGNPSGYLHPDLREALFRLDSKGDSRLNASAVGIKLRGMRGRIVDGLKLEKGEDTHRSKWRVVKV